VKAQDLGRDVLGGGASISSFARQALSGLVGDRNPQLGHRTMVATHCSPPCRHGPSDGWRHALPAPSRSGRARHQDSQAGTLSSMQGPWLHRPAAGPEANSLRGRPLLRPALPTSPSCLPEDRVRRYHGSAMIRTNALTTCRLSQNGSGHATISTAQKADVGIICAKSHVIFHLLWLHAQWRAVLRPRH